MHGAKSYPGLLGSSDTKTQGRGRWHAALALFGVMLGAAVLVAAPFGAAASTIAWQAFAGSGSQGLVDGLALSAQFSEPYDVAEGPDGSFYVVDQASMSVRKIALVGGAWEVSTIATDSAGFWYPEGIACDSAGALYVTSPGNGRLMKIPAGGPLSTWYPSVTLRRCVMSPDGEHLLATGGNSVWQYDLSGAGETRIAGTGVAYESDGTSTTATFNNPRGIACDADGNIFVTDYSGQTIRRVDHETRAVTTIAGFPQNRDFADGAGSNARFSSPMDIAYDAGSGDLIVADQGNGCIRRLRLDGGEWQVTTMGARSGFRNPMGVGVGADGSFYVASSYDQRIFRGEAIPDITGLSSPTHSSETTWYSDSAPSFTWDAAPKVAGYSYLFDQSPTSDVDAAIDPVQTGYTVIPGSNASPQLYWCVAVADFDKDGVQDVVGAGNYPSGFQISLGMGDNTFAAPVYYQVTPGWGGGGAWRVVVGDFNGDTWPDIAVTTFDWQSKVMVYLNDGDGTFGVERTLSGIGYYSLSSAAGDVNGDGYDDVILATHYATENGIDDSVGGSVSVFISNGDGTFQSPTTYLTRLKPIDVAVADLNGDDHLDIVTVNNTPSAFVSVLLNDGDGTFPEVVDRGLVTAYAAGQLSRGLAVVDFDGDGNLDVATIDQADGSVLILRGNGDGTLAAASPCVTGAMGYGLAAGDLNGDGAPDLALAWGRIAMNDGDGGFASSVNDLPNAGAGNGSSLAIAEFDDDGVNEIVVSDYAPYGFSVIEPTAPSVKFPGTADGTWYLHVRAVSPDGPAGTVSTRKVMIDTHAPELSLSGAVDGGVYIAGTAPQAILTATDPNMPDASGIARVRYFDPVIGAWVAVAGGTATFDLPTSAGEYYYECDTSDAAGNYGSLYFTVTIVGDVTGLNSPTHPDPTSWYANDSPEFGWVVQSGASYSYDLDQTADSTPDTEADAISGAAYESYPVGANPMMLATGDFNEDGHPDIVTSNYDDWSVTIQLNQGGGTFQDSETGVGAPGDAGAPARVDSGLGARSYPVGESPSGVAVADFDGDGHLDLAVASYEESSVRILIGAGDGTFSDGATYDCIAYPWQVAVGDFNGDDKPDLAVAGDNDSQFCTLLNNGEDFDAAVYSGMEEYAEGGIAAADFDHDGLDDIAVSYEGGVAIAHNDGEGFNSGQYIETGYYASELAVGDLNGDGCADIVAPDNDSGYLYVLWNDGDGDFDSEATTELDQISCCSYGVALGDINGDGHLDIIDANEDEDTVSVWLWEGMSFGDRQDFAADSLGYGVVSADFDGDGKDDIATGNHAGIPEKVGVVGMPSSSGGVSVLLAGGSSAVTCGPIEDGVWYFHVRTVGSDGTGGSTETTSVKIDTHAPTTQLTGVVDGSTYYVNKQATITAIDLFSGVAWVEWRLPGGGWTQVANSVVTIDIPAAAGGTFSWGYRTSDHAGNVSEPTTFTVTVVSAQARDDAATSYSRPVYITPLTNDDAGVGFVQSFTQPGDGTVVRSATETAPPTKGSTGRLPEGYNTLIYTPDAGFLGQDTFQYTTSSGQSATVTVTVVAGLASPTGVEASRLTSTSVDVEWTAPVSFGSGFASYRVAWRSQGTVDWNLLDAITSAGTTSQTVGGLVPGVTYEFKVIVTDTGEYSATSDIASFLLIGDAPGGVIPPVTVHGGTPATFTVEGVSEDSSLTVDPDADEIPGVGRVVIEGLSVSVVPEPGFSGVIELPVTVTDDGASSTVIARITVSPGDPYNVTFGPTSAARTRVQWAGSVNATGYLVYVGGSVVATVGPGVSSYTISRLLGPNSGVAVQAIGNDDTRSAIVRGTYQPGVNIKIGTITFKANSAVLTSSAKSTLRALAKLVKAQGFTALTINGITGKGAHGSAAFRKRLATARGNAVKAYLAATFKALHVNVKITIITKTGTAISWKYRVAEIVLR